MKLKGIMIRGTFFHNVIKKYMLDRLIENVISIERSFVNFRKRFFQAADFFKKYLSGGTFSEHDLCGCDFRESVLKNVNFSRVKFGLSFVRLFLLTGCFLFSLYVSSDPTALIQGLTISTSSERQSEIMMSLILKPLSIFGFTAFNSFFLFLLAFSIYYWMSSSYLFTTLDSKAKERGIIIQEKTLNKFMNSNFILKLYSPVFGVSFASTAILSLGTDSTKDIIRLIWNSSNEYQKEISLCIFVFKILSWLVTVCFSFYLPAFFSSSMWILTTSFEKSIMSNIDFNNVFADKVNFKYSKMKPVNFTGASLRLANFHEIHFKEVNFEDADLTCCNFTESNLEELKGVNFKNAILDGAYYKKGDMTYHISTIPGFAN